MDRTDKSPPAAKFWRLQFKGPFLHQRTPVCDSCVDENNILYFGTILMHSGNTDVKFVGNELPMLHMDANLVSVTYSDENYEINTASTEVSWNHNDSTKIGEGVHGIHYSHNNLTDITTGGFLQYEFDAPCSINEIWIANTLDASGSSYMPTKLIINYSTDGDKWNTEKVYHYGVDMNVDFLNSDKANPNETSVLLFKRNVDTLNWASAVKLNNIRAGSSSTRHQAKPFQWNYFHNVITSKKVNCNKFRNIPYDRNLDNTKLCSNTPYVNNYTERFNANIHLSGFLSKESVHMNYGFSYYIPVWKPLSNNVQHTDVSLPYGFVYTTEEGCGIKQMISASVQYLHTHKFKHTMPKLMMHGSVNCNRTSVNSPGFRLSKASNCITGPLKDADMMIVQFNNRILIPPDGMTFEYTPENKVIGISYMTLPLTNETASVGNNNWTLFLNTHNFKGPVAYFLPERFKYVKDGREMGLDRAMKSYGLHMMMDLDNLPVEKQGDYGKIPLLKFPLNHGNNSTNLVSDVYYYSENSVFEKVREVGDKVRRSESVDMSAVDLFFMSSISNGFKAPLYSSPTSFTIGKRRVVNIEPNIVEKVTYQNTNLNYKWSGVTSENISHKFVNFPEYYHKWAPDAWRPVSSRDVPASLRNFNFEEDTNQGGAYNAFNSSGNLTGAWASPGPSAGPYRVLLNDGSVVVYYWYKFINQPSFHQIRSSKTASEWNHLQTIVEKLHAWSKPNNNYIPNPSAGKELISMDTSLLVCPPTGMENGYVPVVAMQYKYRPEFATNECKNTTHVMEPSLASKHASIACSLDQKTYKSVNSTDSCGSIDPSLVEISSVNDCKHAINNIGSFLNDTNTLVSSMTSSNAPYGCSYRANAVGKLSTSSYSDSVSGSMTHTEDVFKVCEVVSSAQTVRDQLIQKRTGRIQRIQHMESIVKKTVDQTKRMNFTKDLEAKTTTFLETIHSVDSTKSTMDTILTYTATNGINTDTVLNDLINEYNRFVSREYNGLYSNFMSTSNSLETILLNDALLLDETAVNSHLQGLANIISSISSLQSSINSYRSRITDDVIQAFRHKIDSMTTNSVTLTTVRNRVDTIQIEIDDNAVIDDINTRVTNQYNEFKDRFGLESDNIYKRNRTIFNDIYTQFSDTTAVIETTLSEINSILTTITSLNTQKDSITDIETMQNLMNEIDRYVLEDIVLLHNTLNEDVSKYTLLLREIDSSDRIITKYLTDKLRVDIRQRKITIDTEFDSMQSKATRANENIEEMQDLLTTRQYIQGKSVYSDISFKFVNRIPTAMSHNYVLSNTLSTIESIVNDLDTTNIELANATDIYTLVDRFTNSKISFTDKFDQINNLKTSMRTALITYSNANYTRMNADASQIVVFRSDKAIEIAAMERDRITSQLNQVVDLIQRSTDKRWLKSRHIQYETQLIDGLTEQKTSLEALKSQFETKKIQYNENIRSLILELNLHFPIRNVNKFPVATDFDKFAELYNAMYNDPNSIQSQFDDIMGMETELLTNETLRHQKINEYNGFKSMYEAAAFVSTTRYSNARSDSFDQTTLFDPSLPSDNMLQQYTVYNNIFVNFHNKFDERLKIIFEINSSIQLKNLSLEIAQSEPTKNAYFVFQLYSGVLNFSFKDRNLGGTVGRFKSVDTAGNLIDPIMNDTYNSEIANLSGRIRFEFVYKKSDGLSHSITANSNVYHLDNLSQLDSNGNVRWINEGDYQRYITEKIPEEYNARGDRDELLFKQSSYSLKVFQPNITLEAIDVSQFSFENYLNPAEPCEGEWSNWTDCDKECGGGFQERTYKILRGARHGGGTCEADNGQVQSRRCNETICPIPCRGGWGMWETPCEGDLQYHTYNIHVNAEHLGASCPHPDGHRESRPCPRRCEGDYVEHGECSKECGGGMQEYRYEITTPANGTGEGCPFVEGHQSFGACNPQPCEPVNCTGVWSEWTACDQPCGERKKQTRELSVTSEEKYGGTCVTSEERDCPIIPCPIDCVGGWCNGTSDCDGWSECSALCDGGTRTRTYTIKSEMQHDGIQCLHLDGKEEKEDCNTFACNTLDCMGTWAPWEPCDQPCGESKIIRRVFNVVEPAKPGGTCPISPEEDVCPIVPCPVPCIWEWEDFGECQIENKCGTGVRTRTLNIKQRPLHGGTACPVFENSDYEEECSICEFETPQTNDIPTIVPSITVGGKLDNRTLYVNYSHPTRKENIRFFIDIDIEMRRPTFDIKDLILMVSQRMVDGIRPRNGFHLQFYQGIMMLQYLDSDFNENPNLIYEINKLPNGYFNVTDIPGINDTTTNRIRIKAMLTKSHDFIVQINDYKIDRTNSKIAYRHGNDTIKKYMDKLFRYPECTHPKYTISTYSHSVYLHSIYVEQYTSSNECIGFTNWTPCINELQCGNDGVRNQYFERALYQLEGCVEPTVITNERCTASGYRACGSPEIVNDAMYEDSFTPKLLTGMLLDPRIRHYMNTIHNTNDSNVVLYFEMVFVLPDGLKFQDGTPHAILIDQKTLVGSDPDVYWMFKMNGQHYQFIIWDRKYYPNKRIPELFFGKIDTRTLDEIQNLQGELSLKIIYTVDQGLGITINDIDLRYHKRFHNHLPYTQTMGRDVEFTSDKYFVQSDLTGVEIKRIYCEQNTPVSLIDSEHSALYDEYVGRYNLMTWAVGRKVRQDTMNLPGHEVMQLCNDTPRCEVVNQRLWDGAQSYYEMNDYDRAKRDFVTNESVGNYTIFKHRGDKDAIMDTEPTWAKHVKNDMSAPYHTDAYVEFIKYYPGTNTIVNESPINWKHFTDLSFIHHYAYYTGLGPKFRDLHNWSNQDFFDLMNNPSESQLKNYCALKLGMLKEAKFRNRLQSDTTFNRVLTATRAECGNLFLEDETLW